MKVLRSLLGFSLGLLVMAAASPAQTGCAPTIGKTTTALPQFSGTVNGVLAMSATGGQYVYVLTQYGVARGSLANPSKPGPFVLAQIGHKNLGGVDNGGKVDMLCDCYQGGTTTDAAEASDGSARMISDWNNRGGGLGAEVATADAQNNMAFGQQIDDGSRVLGARVAALFLASGKYVGYFPFSSGANQGGVAFVDVTTTSGFASASGALKPFGTLSWGNGSAVILKTAVIGGKYLLVGGVNLEGKIRIAEVDSSTGIPSEKANVSTAGTVNSLAIAAVNGRTFIFSAEGTAGVQIYEYAAGALTASGALTGGNFNEVVLTGGTFPLLFAHNVVSILGRESYIEVFDTNWVTQGGAPRQAAHLRHTGAPENYIGKGFQAFVSGSNAYVYRIQPNTGSGESLVSATQLDVSCIAIDPSSPPIANSVATNLSAGLRQGVERTINYYGDKWEIQDASASSTSPPANGLDQIEWDWNYGSSFSPSTGWSLLPYTASNSDVRPAYFPCDPSAGGDIRTGAGCAASLGPTSPSYRYALHTHNGNGWSAVPSVSQPIPVAAPQARIAGLDTSVSPPVLRVLSGQGIADASGSQGNLAEATFLWQFTPGGGGSTPSVAVPANATAFSLTITYPGGYTAAISGNVSQVDLVPDFSPASGSMTVGGSLTITNRMQKASSVIVTSVEYAWVAGSYSDLSSAFNVVNGQATVPAPSFGNNHTLTLRYNYSKNGVTQAPVTVSHGPFNVTNSLTVSVSGPPGGKGQANQSITFVAAVVGGSGSPTFSWCFEACSVFPTFTPGPATNSHVFKSAGTYTVVVKVNDSGSTGTGSTAIVISGGCVSNCGGGGGPTASISGPSTAQANAPVSFTAVVSGGTPPYTYAWRWGDNALSGYVAGPQTNTYTYGSAGTFNVSVRVTDAGGKSTTASKAVIVNNAGGKPGPNGTFDVSGASVNPFNGQYEATAFQPITLTAREANASAYAWDFGDGTSGAGRSVVKSYNAAGTFTVRLTVTGDTQHTVGTVTGSKKFAIGAPQFSAVVVPDAASLVTADGAWKTDVTVTNGGSTPITITPLYKSYESLVPAPPATGVDVTSLGFDSATKYTLAPGGSWSQSDVVGFFGGSGKGNLFIETEGGPTPDVAARVSFTSSDPEKGSFGNALPSFEVGAFGQVGTQQIRAVSPQTIVGLRTDDKFRFKLKLYNSSGSLNGFRVTAFDEAGNPATLKDDAGNPASSLDFAVGAYQSAELGGDRLGLDDPAHRYVVKAVPVTTGAMLLASASIIDRVTNDQVQVADDALRPSAEGGNAVCWVPAISRFDGATAHWRTSVAILNSGSATRGVLVEYLYGPDKIAQNFFAMDSGKLLSFDDVSELFPNVAEVTGSGTSGLLRVTYPADGETPTNPVYVSARSFDDRSATTGGTSGTALSTYAAGDAVAADGTVLVIPGAEQDDRFRTNVGVFTLDDGPAGALVWAVDKDGNAIGSPIGIALNQSGSGPWSQFPISAIPNLPAEPFSVRVQSLGGRVSAYAFNIDQKSLDTTFIKATQ